MSNKTFDRDYIGLNGFVWFIGVVEDIMDPLKTGRVKVRCYDWHVANKGTIPTSDLPWAQVMMSANNPSASGIGTSPNGQAPFPPTTASFARSAKEQKFNS